MNTLDLYKQLSKFPMGKLIFSKALAFRAPYFSSIKALITDLGPGYCRAEMKDRRLIRNYIGSINAGAMYTLSELTGGLAMEAATPDHLRWIPMDMTVKYTKKATGKLTGKCAFNLEILKPGNINIPFEIKDETGEIVLKTEILFYISDRK